MKKNTSGFTIVELLIVIVVIAILATISTVAYGSIQTRARDAARTDSIAKIKKALELYKIQNGSYPTATANPGWLGWETSSDAEGTFMEYLSGQVLAGNAPVDPINDATHRFYYFSYPAGGGGTAGCDPSRGRFYVLVVRYENIANKPAGNSMATECTNPNSMWIDSGYNYAFHAYEN